MSEVILSLSWGECEFEIAHTNDVGKADTKGGRIGLRWSKTHTGSKNGFPTNQNGNKAYVVLPDNIARLLLGALLGSDDKNITQNKNSLFEALSKFN